MSENNKPDDQFRKLKQLTADDLLLLVLIENLTDETFAAQYAHANNLSKQSPDYRPVQ